MAAICTRVVLLKQNLGLGPRGALFKNMSEGPGKPFTMQHTELPPVALSVANVAAKRNTVQKYLGTFTRAATRAPI
mgnify:CR=1 FL=1